MGAGELLTLARCCLVPFVCAGHHLWAVVVCFVFYSIGCGVTCVATFVIVIRVCSGGWGRSNDGHRWSITILCVSKVGWEECGMGY